MKVKSFSEYFKDYKNYDNGGELDQRIVADAKKVFETLKSPLVIEGFMGAPVEERSKWVKGLSQGHNNFSFASVCFLAGQYAQYKANNDPFTFAQYYKGYKNYDKGGPLDKRIVADAERVYNTLKTPKAIEKFMRASVDKQYKTVQGLSDGHSGFSFYCMCRMAHRYAEYAALCGKSLLAKLERASQKAKAPVLPPNDRGGRD